MLGDAIYHFRIMLMMMRLALLLCTLIIHVQCNIENNETYYSTTPSIDVIKTTSTLQPDYASNTTTTAAAADDSENIMTLSPIIHGDLVNISYVIIPSELYLGQTNLITVRSRQPKTKLSISINLTGLSTTVNDEHVYKLVRLKNISSQHWYGLDIPYQLPFIFDNHEESIWVKMIFNFTHCYNNEIESADDDDDNDDEDDDDDDKDDNDNDNDQCVNYKTTQIIHSVQLKQLPIMIIGETDKPLYRPGESVNFRYLAININNLSPKSTDTELPLKKLIVKKKSKYEIKDINKYDLLKLQNILYKEIYITDPMNNRIKQWLKVSPKQALNLSYPLLNKAIEGKWKIHAIIGRHTKEILEFTVKKYTLPKFTMTLDTPKIFHLNSQYVQYSICAKYTNGPPLKGSVKSILCVCSEYSWDGEYPVGEDEKTIDSLLSTRKCPSMMNGYEVKLRPCITHNQLLQSDGCAHFNVSTKEFALSTDKYPKWNQISILCGYVEEDGTGSKLYNCLKGQEIKNDQPNIKLEFPSVYKSKLPITGIVKLTSYDEMSTNYSIKISVSEHKWGCYWRGSNEKGKEYYINIIPVSSLTTASIIHIPPIHAENPISVEAELLLPSGVPLPPSIESIAKDTSITQPNSNYYFWPDGPLSPSNPITDSITLRSWDSVSKIYLQLWPPKDKIITTCPNTIKLVLLSNIRLSDKIIFIESVIRGKHMKIVIPAVANSDVNDDCIDRDDELGHYKCLGKNSEEIKCLSGWQGENCLVPICASDCNLKGGLCIKPNECQCKSGWTGVNCDQCIKREKCLHGKCIQGNDCICDEGWTGYNCDRKPIIYEEITEDNETITTNTTTPSVNEVNLIDEVESSSTSSSNSVEINTQPLRTLYQRQIEFTIDGSWGPKFTAIIYIHNLQDKMSPEIISTQLTVEQIENCTSNAIALQSKSDKSSIEFSQNIADPGQQIEMIITPQGVSSSSTDQENNCYNTSTKHCKNKGQLSNELCFVRISDTSLDNFQDDKNLINLKSFTEKLIDFAMQAGIRPTIATSTHEAFQAAGFQIGSTYPEPVFVHRLYACPHSLQSNVALVLDDSGTSNNNNAFPQPLPLYKSMYAPVKPRLRDFFPEVWLFQVLPVTDLQVSHEVDENAKKIDTTEINESRGIKLNLTVPDTITSWRASAYCTTKSNGLWIGEPQTITVNMPFYLELTLPKEMKRGEILHIPVSVFILDRKYLEKGENSISTECYQIFVNIQVNTNEWLVVGKNSYSSCLCSGDKVTYLVGLQAKRLGKLNITAEALAIKNSLSCKSTKYSELETSLTLQSNTSRRKEFQPKLLTDKIRRHINIIPEGVEHETTISDIICLNEQENQSQREFEFILPKDIIKNSLHSYISYTDEVLGPALVNLDKLVRLPTGCGEQNMVLVAPNVYILDYLKSTPNINANENKINYIQSAKLHIISGYNQQLKYRHEDGSFSAFGKSDKEGSTWLTAFVIRVFAKAYKLEPNLTIEWEENLFKDGIEFLLSRQNNQTGCFEEYGKVLYSPLQGISGMEESGELKDILLTSYVSSALYETRPNDADNANNNSNVKYTSKVEDAYNNGLKCINQYLENFESYNQLPTSVLVQLTHTYTLIQPNSQLTTDLHETIMKKKQVLNDQFGEKIYWSDKLDIITSNTSNPNLNPNKNNNEPRDLESTAYAFLSLNRFNHTVVNDLFPIIRWISSKQKSNGGFYSTQDTVLGLEALAEFAKKLGLHNDNQKTNISHSVLQITNNINIGNFKLNDTITLDKRQVINQIELPNLHSEDDEDNKVIHSVWKLRSNQPVKKDCMLVQNTFIYNLPDMEDTKTKFKLSYNIIQKTTSTSVDVNCKSAKLVMCLQFNSRLDEIPISTGMLLIRVAMVTGWEPIIEQLNSQLRSQVDSLKMFTMNDEQNEISLYFNEFSEEESIELGGWEHLKRCVDVPLSQVYYVENAKNATITAYEYYSPEESVTINYRLDECKEAWNMDIMSSTTETPLVTSSEPTVLTDTTVEDVQPKVETHCPICIDKVTDTELLLNNIFNSVCNQSNGIYFLKIHQIQNDNNSASINATITHIIESDFTMTWNTTLQMPNLLTQCPCHLIKTHQNLVVLLFDAYVEISPGDPKINLMETLTTPVKLISDKEILPILEIAAHKWSDVEKFSDKSTTGGHQCKRLSKIVKFMKEKSQN